MYRLVRTPKVSIKVLAPVLAKVLALLVLSTNVATLQAQTLKGSRESMQRQNMLAVSYGYSFLENPQAINRFIDAGHLVKIQKTRLMDLHSVSYPYARPAVKVFLDRLSSQYFSACGEPMTVTSLTRPMNKQPANASQNSVHPTGMAVDLRIPGTGKCRSWLESTLLSLEKADVLDVTRERNPPHYHIALFTQPYEAYVAGADAVSPPQGSSEYKVRKGDSLSAIATRTGTSIAQLRAANGIRGDMIVVGQVLQVPGTAPAPTASIQVAATQTKASQSEASKPQQVAAISEVKHQVRRGETLWRIASRYGTSVRHIREENGLADDLLQVGQVLRVKM